MEWIYGTILLATSLILAYIYFTRRFNYWKDRNVYYIKPTLFFGNVLSALGKKQTVGEWLRDECHNIKKEYFGIFIFNQPVLIVNSPKLVKAIIQKDFSTFADRTISSHDFHEILSNFLFLSRNIKWKELRAKASPVFSRSKLKDMFQLILNESNSMVDYISKYANIPNVESDEICANYSTNVTARCFYAVDAQCFQEKDPEFRQLGRKLFGTRLANSFRHLLSWVAPDLLSLLKVPFMDGEAINRLALIFKEVLNKRMETSLKGNDLIGILLNVQKEDKDSGLVTNAMVGLAVQFFVAGIETFSAILNFALYEICMHPDVQEKLRREITENFEKHQGLTYEGIQEMQYLDLCVSETLRKYPVIPFIDRICNKNYKVDGTDLVIEKGMPVYIPLFALHYNPEYYPEPEKFIPERFEDMSKINRDGLNYIPFGVGPRICIGNTFALLGIKTGIANILLKFKLEVSDKTPIPMKLEPTNLVPASTVGIPLRFVPTQEE